LSKTSCIITDVEMRQMSGLGLLHHVKSVNSPVPVVIITGEPSENSEAFYLERGGSDSSASQSTATRSWTYSSQLPSHRPISATGNSSLLSPSCAGVDIL
jgi:CheY-like chemotaxis protein